MYGGPTFFPPPRHKPGPGTPRDRVDGAYDAPNGLREDQANARLPLSMCIDARSWSKSSSEAEGPPALRPASAPPALSPVLPRRSIPRMIER